MKKRLETIKDVLWIVFELLADLLLLIGIISFFASLIQG